MTLPLEDDFNDILGKAQRGLGWNEEELSRRAGVTIVELRTALAGQFNERVVRLLANSLDLGADALAALGRKEWYPRDPGELPGFAMIHTSWGAMTVNSFLIWEESTRRAVAFDTGGDGHAVRKSADRLRLCIKLILLTHGHNDHAGGLDSLKVATGAPAYAGRDENVTGAEPIDDGRSFSLGGLHLEARQTSGHSRGGVTYVVTGLSRRLAVVGDALFAGSMGGGMVSYADALRNNREKILTLPDATILCPGHGPLTTVGEEKRHNPFFAG